MPALASSNGLHLAFESVNHNWLIIFQNLQSFGLPGCLFLKGMIVTSSAGAFLAVSSNTRYQIINGLERLVEASPVARKVPPVAMAFTVGVRFANNIYGGMQFVDWARLTGCQ